MEFYNVENKYGELFSWHPPLGNNIRIRCFTNFVLYFVFSLKSLLLCRPFLASIHWSCEKWPANGSGLDTYMRILTTLHTSCRRESGCSRFEKKRIILEHPVHTATAFPSESQSINPATFYYQLFLPLPPGGLFSHACTHKIYVQCTASSNSWLYWSSYIYPYLRAFITNEKNH